MVEIAVIKDTIINYDGRVIPLSTLPKGIYSIQLERDHPIYPYVRGDGKNVAEKIFRSPLNKSGRLKCEKLEVDEVKPPHMFRLRGEVD